MIFGLETQLLPGLGTTDIKLFVLMFFVTAVFIGIYLPIQYQLGYEKTKFAFAVIIVASPILLPLLMRMDTMGLALSVPLPMPFLYGGVFLAGVLILVLSVMLSVKIYSKADLA